MTQDVEQAAGDVSMLEILKAAGDVTQTPGNIPATYGEKYHEAHASIVQNGIDASRLYADLAEKHRKISQDYDVLAEKVRNSAHKAADDYVVSMKKLDKIEAAAMED